MARLPIPEIDSLPAERRRAIEAAKASMGFVANDALLMSADPHLTDTFAALVGAIYKPGEVAPGLKRLIGLVTSSASGCQYCVSHTAHTSQMNGIEAQKLAEIWEFETSAHYSPPERIALRIAMHAGQAPNGVTDAMFEELREYYSDEAVLEIVSVIALFGFLNRWNSTLATDIESAPGASLQMVSMENSRRLESE